MEVNREEFFRFLDFGFVFLINLIYEFFYRFCIGVVVFLFFFCFIRVVGSKFTCFLYIYMYMYVRIFVYSVCLFRIGILFFVVFE